MGQVMGSISGFLVAPVLFFLALIPNAQAITIKVPSYMEGIYPDSVQKNREDYYYKAEGMFIPKKIKPQFTENKTIEDLTASVIKCYADNQPEKFKALFTPEGLQKATRIGDEAFQSMWKQFKPQEEYVLNWYFKHAGGMIVSWKAVPNKDSTFYFARKIKEKWSLDYFSTDQKDIYFQNVVTYLNFAPLELKQAVLIKDFRLADKEPSLVAQIELPILTVLKKDGADWKVLTWLYDNQEEKVIYKDLEKAKGLVKIIFDKSEFAQNKKDELLIMQSTYPLSFLPGKLVFRGQIQL